MEHKKQQMDTSVFTDIKVKNPNKNVFDMSHGHKTTMKFGSLVPILLQECLPNDTYKLQLNQMVRLLPLATPVMHEIEVFTHSFFVPARILWPNFENFIRGPRTATDNAQWAVPTLGPLSGAPGISEPAGIRSSSLANYLGLPVGFTSLLQQDGAGDQFNISALPFAAYQRIYFDYYRDENLQGPLEEFPELQDGEQDDVNGEFWTKLQYRAWEHDYFTSSLPFAQKGEPVPIPISGDIDVVYDPTGPGIKLGNWERQDTGAPITNQEMSTNSLGVTYFTPGAIVGNYNPQDTLKAIIQNITTTVRDLRVAEALQTFLETNARAGNRYFEYLRAIFGQTSPDSRLQRSEYIGGSKHVMSISEILQTSATQANSPQGQMAGHAISVGSSDNSTYHCQEHGYIITLMNVRPRTSYGQGLHRLWRRFDRFDYAIPAFAHIGEQETKNYELYFDRNRTEIANESAFGYMPRFAEYKTNINRTSGAFMDSGLQGLAPWVMPRLFSSLPRLNSGFITVDVQNNIFPLEMNEMGDYILVDTEFNITKSSVLPRFDIPSLQA